MLTSWLPHPSRNQVGPTLRVRLNSLTACCIGLLIEFARKSLRRTFPWEFPAGACQIKFHRSSTLITILIACNGSAPIRSGFNRPENLGLALQGGAI